MSRMCRCVDVCKQYELVMELCSSLTSRTRSPKNGIVSRVSGANVVPRVLRHALTRTKNQLKQIVIRISWLHATPISNEWQSNERIAPGYLFKRKITSSKMLHSDDFCWRRTKNYIFFSLVVCFASRLIMYENANN